MSAEADKSLTMSYRGAPIAYINLLYVKYLNKYKSSKITKCLSSSLVVC